MSTIPRLSRAMRHVLCASAEQAGRESGLIRRERKLTGATFVQSLVFGWIENPEATVTERAQIAAARGVQISAYGLEKRLDEERACECLRLVLARAMREVVVASASSAAIPVLRRFSGVYLYDASVVGLPEVLKEEWPGTGCAAGPTASVKVGARLDLLSGELYVPPMRAAREHDRTLALEAEAMPEGALRLADLGFFDLGLLARLGAKGCYWLTRLMARTALYERDTAIRLDLAQTLSALERSGRQTLELEVLVGAKARLPARLLAARVPEAVANQRRRKLREEARQRGRQPSKERLKRCGWTVLIANVPAEMLSLKEALVLMRSRWQIEKLFELWKRYGHLDKSRSEKPWRVMCEIYAKLIGLVVQHWIILVGSWHAAERSLVKAARVVRRRALTLAEALENPRRLARVLGDIARCLQRGCRVDKRRKEPGTAQQLLALTNAGKEAAIA
jgi:Transposase DDE domain